MAQDHLKSWAAGFLDGEGCFTVEIKRYKDGRKKDTYLRPKLAVQVRDDDEISIRMLQKAFGNDGYFYKRKSRKISTYGSVSKPTVECTWHSKESLKAVVGVLKKHPLLGKKSADYEIWKKAVSVALDLKIGRLQKHELLTGLRQELIEKRKYKTH